MIDTVAIQDGMRVKIARELCRAEGHDPDGPTCDVWVPDDPECIFPWAPWRKHADAILAIPEIKEALERYPRLREFAGDVSKAWGEKPNAQT